MEFRSREPWSIAWHAALIVSFVFLGVLVFWGEPWVLYGLAAVAAAAFLIGLVRLAMRVRVHKPFRDVERFKWLSAAAVFLLATGFFLPRAFYQWGRFENESPMPEWAFSVGIGLAIIIVFSLAMLIIWLAWATLVRVREAPTPVETGGALAVAIGVSILLLGAIVVRTDYTSEDILFFTLPFGLAISLSGTAVLVLADVWRRIRLGEEVPGPHEDEVQ